MVGWDIIPRCLQPAEVALVKVTGRRHGTKVCLSLINNEESQSSGDSCDHVSIKKSAL